MKPILVPYDENMTKEELLKEIANAVGSDVETVKKELCETKDESQKSCSTCGYSPQTPSCDTCEGYSNWWSLKDESQADCETCKYDVIEDDYDLYDMCEPMVEGECRYEPKDKPQKIGYCNEFKWFRDKQVWGRCRSKNMYAPKTEPQTESLEQFRVGLEYHTDTTHFGKVKGESITTNKVEDEPQMGDAKPIPLSNRVTHIKDEPQTIRCPKCGRSDYIREFGKDFSVTAEEAGFKYKCINCNTYIKTEPQTERSE